LPGAAPEAAAAAAAAAAADTVSMTTHAYFNLNGHNSTTNVTDHTVQLHSSYYTPVHNNTIVPTGEVASVAGTPFDLRQPTVLGTVIDQV
jgi:aldose 1-epimerase